MIRLSFLAAALLGLAGCSPMTTGSIQPVATAAGSYQPAMVTYGDALAPPAFYSFCNRDKRSCSTRGKRRAMRLTASRRAELHRVNTHVNASVREVDDRISEGAPDVWQAATDVGDCEDIAILKKDRLMALGWPASTLLLTVVRPKYGNEGHTILTVRTSDGDLILDNLNNDVRLWSHTPYRFYARQSVARQGGWEFIRKPV